jgi:hypothetical protein
LREALASADHDFVVSEPASKLTRLREKLRTAKRRGLRRTARQNRRHVSVVATGILLVAAVAILLNVLAWQRTHHPAPLFARAAPAIQAKEPRIAETVAAPAPRPQPALTTPQAHDKSSERPPAPKPLIEKPVLEVPASGHVRQTSVNAAPVRPHDTISELIEAAPVQEKAAPVQQKAASTPRRPSTPLNAASAAPSKSVLAAQRALVKLGFVLRPDGVAGKTTRLAIESYERDHKLPVHGDLTPAVMRRLSAQTGIAVER